MNIRYPLYEGVYRILTFIQGYILHIPTQSRIISLQSNRIRRNVHPHILRIVPEPIVMQSHFFILILSLMPEWAEVLQ